MLHSQSTGGHGADRMVERQMRNWELARSQRIDAPKKPVAEVADFVTISRQVGIGAAEVATQLAERLGWPLFDRELLRIMAGDNDLQKRLYESLDEKDINWFRNAFATFFDSRLDEDDYFHHLSRTVLSLARQGSAVYLGRGVDRMMPRKLGLRVRLVAPLDWRVKAYARRNELPLDKAAADVKRIDQERTVFVKHHFAADINDPVAYDLTLSAERFTQPQLVEIIFAAHQAMAASET